MSAIVPLSRRQLLEMLLLIPGAVFFGCNGKNLFKQESVCVHVYRPRQFVPAPLLERSGAPFPERKEGLFTIGIPELLICSMSYSLLETFQYFWPLTEDEFRAFERKMVIKFSIDEIKGAEDIVRFRDHLRTSDKREQSYSRKNTIVVFTLNEFTKRLTFEVASICRESDVEELVIFKDPSVSPYLCDHPSLQKGFKRKPL